MPDWEAEGLLDGLQGAERAERADLLDYLHDDVGIATERLRDQDPALLITMPAQRHVGGEPRHTEREIAQRAGIDLGLADRLRRAMGLPAVDPDERSLGDADMESLRLADQYLQAGMAEEDVIAVTRVLGRGLGQAAGVMRQVAMRMALEPGLSERQLAERFSAIAAMLTPQTVPIMEQTLKLQLRQMLSTEVARATERLSGSLPGAREIGVAFADLVGFTRLGEDVPPEELGAVASRLEDLAGDVLCPPVRIVKTIGDAVMYVSEEPRALLEASIDLSAVADEQGEEFPQLRVGLAAGPAMNRAGDWFGRPVNLASRVTAIARPGSVVCTEAVRDAAGDEGLRYSFIGARKLKGVPGSIALFRARSDAAGDEARAGGR